MCPYFIAEFRNRLINAVAGLATCNDSQSSRDMYAFQTLSKCVSVMYCKNGEENIFFTYYLKSLKNKLLYI